MRSDSPNEQDRRPAVPKLLDRVRAAIRARHYSLRTEEAYIAWVRRYVLFHGKRHPSELGPAEITGFLTALAVEARVSASTQNQALAALLFLYREVLACDPGWLEGIVRARRPKRLPVVLTRSEVERLLGGLRGVHWIMGMLLYGAGLRLIECLRLRVQDVDFVRHEIFVRDGKGHKDRVTMLPQAAAGPLVRHLDRRRALFDADCAAGAGSVALPDALARKYAAAPREWAWQWIFPAAKLSIDPRSGERRRHHLHESVLQSRARRSAPRRHRQAGRPAYVATLLRNPSPRGRVRYPHGAGVARTPRCGDDNDLHARPQPRRSRRREPRRPPPGHRPFGCYPAGRGRANTARIRAAPFAKQLIMRLKCPILAFASHGDTPPPRSADSRTRWYR